MTPISGAGRSYRQRVQAPPSFVTRARPSRLAFLPRANCNACAIHLISKIKPASINRLFRGLKAALNLAAKHDARITNASAWRIGLAALPDAYQARNTVLTDEQVRALITAAYAEDPALGVLTELGAVTGARSFQLARLEVGDLQLEHADGPRLLMPSSRKGRGRKRIDRYPVPIPASLANRLRQAAGEREMSAPLLLRTSGRAWSKSSADYRRPFQRAVAKAGLDPRHDVLRVCVTARSCARCSRRCPSVSWRFAHDTSVADDRVAPIHALSAITPMRFCGARNSTLRIQLETMSLRWPGGDREQVPKKCR